MIFLNGLFYVNPVLDPHVYLNIKRIGGRSIEAQAQSCTGRTVQAGHRNDEPTNFLRLGIQLYIFKLKLPLIGNKLN
jgi:hypothetical protein